MKAEPLHYKEDWPEARERLFALWEHEILDRACIAIVAPREFQEPLPGADDIEAEITDLDLRRARMEAYCRNTYFAGEAIPMAGTPVFYAVYGGDPRFQRVETEFSGTAWIDPIINDWSTPFRFDPENPWLWRYLEAARRDYIDGRGRYLSGAVAALPPTDALSMLRGPERLCLDLLEHPDEVQAALAELLSACIHVHERIYETIHADAEGCAPLRVWAPGKNFAFSCDFSCMISPRHYRRFVLPEIYALCEWADYTFYHLDGPNALQHLPALLEVERLRGVQYQPTARSIGIPATRWVPYYKQVQAANKIVQMHALYGEVEMLLTELDPRRILIVTTAPSVAAADDLLRNVARWSCKGLHQGWGGAAE